MKLVVLTGIPGSGSTTVLDKALEEVDYLHINYGDVMTEIAIEKGLVEDRDALRKLSPDVQKEIQKLAGIKIKEKSESENVIVDTLKKAEDSEDLVLRVYECFNRRTDCTIDLNVEVSKAIECDLMENDICDAVIEDNVLKFTIKPYEIKTFKIS